MRNFFPSGRRIPRSRPPIGLRWCPGRILFCLLTFIFLIQESGAVPASTIAERAMRPVSADRPDTTESPLTVEPGRVQLEIEWVAWERETRTWNWGSLNLKTGIGPSTDLQLVLPPWAESPVAGEGPHWDGITVRVKQNLFGNEGDGPALALMPWITVPTGPEEDGYQSWAGGVLVPVSFELPGEWAGGAMLAGGGEEAGHETDRQWSVLASVTAGHPLGENLSGFLECVVSRTIGGEDFSEVYGNAGLTLAMGPACQWDAGVRVGLNRLADPFTPFLGLTCKF